MQWANWSPDFRSFDGYHTHARQTHNTIEIIASSAHAAATVLLVVTAMVMATAGATSYSIEYPEDFHAHGWNGVYEGNFTIGQCGFVCGSATWTLEDFPGNFSYHHGMLLGIEEGSQHGYTAKVDFADGSTMSWNGGGFSCLSCTALNAGSMTITITARGFLGGDPVGFIQLQVHPQTYPKPGVVGMASCSKTCGFDAGEAAAATAAAAAPAPAASAAAGSATADGGA